MKINMVFENCEVFQLPSSVEIVLADNTTLEVFKDGHHSIHYTPKTVIFRIPRVIGDAVSASSMFGDLENYTSIINRIKAYPDITSFDFEYEDGSVSPTYYTPWPDEEDYNNPWQTVEYDDYNDEYVVTIKEEKQ